MKKHLVIFISIILIACSSNDKSLQQAHNNTDTLKSKVSLVSYSLDEQPTKTVIDFLKWYKLNYSRLGKIEMVNNNTQNYDSTKFYSVNFEGTENYLSELKKSGFISEVYIESWRQYFKKCDEDFTKNPMNDGPPDGFDYDFVLFTQEIDESLASIDKPQIMSVKIEDKKGVVIVDVYMQLAFYLTNVNGKWVIDKIANTAN